MATTTSKNEKEEELGEPLLQGDADEQDAEPREGGPPEDDPVVRVAVNPSVLDRFLRGDCYYYFDDIDVPYQSLLVGAKSEPLLLPSQKERLLLLATNDDDDDDGEGGGGETPGTGRVFGYLWMRLCARLARAKAESIRDSKSRFRILGIFWVVSAVFLATVFVSEECDGDSAILLFGLVPLGFALYPAIQGYEDGVNEAEAQAIVDEMERFFSDEGFHIDLVTSCPVTHVRIKKAPAPPPPTTTTFATTTTTSGNFASSSSLLKEAMERFQMEALRDHQDALIVRRQEKLKTSRPPDTIFGIRFKTLLWWQPCLKAIIAVAVSLFVMSLVLWIFSPITYYLFEYRSEAIPVELTVTDELVEAVN